MPTSQTLKNTELISELESLGLSIKELNELNDDYELENLLYNLKQMLIQEYKTTPTFTDWLELKKPETELVSFRETTDFS